MYRYQQVYLNSIVSGDKKLYHLPLLAAWRNYISILNWHTSKIRCDYQRKPEKFGHDQYTNSQGLDASPTPYFQRSYKVTQVDSLYILLMQIEKILYDFKMTIFRYQLFIPGTKP